MQSKFTNTNNDVQKVRLFSKLDIGEEYSDSFFKIVVNLYSGTALQSTSCE